MFGSRDLWKVNSKDHAVAASSSDVHAGHDLGDRATPLSGTQLAKRPSRQRPLVSLTSGAGLAKARAEVSGVVALTAAAAIGAPGSAQTLGQQGQRFLTSRGRHRAWAMIVQWHSQRGPPTTKRSVAHAAMCLGDRSRPSVRRAGVAFDTLVGLAHRLYRADERGRRRYVESIQGGNLEAALHRTPGRTDASGFPEEG